jgi:uncharacterized damage-inducible protein DinB
MLGTTLLLKALAHRRWAMARIFAAAAELSDEQYRADAGYGHGSLHALLFHTLRVAATWRGVVTAPDQPPPALAPDDHPNLAAIRAAWEREDAALAALVERLGEEGLAARIQVHHPRYGVQATTRAFPVLQVILHEMQHRSEAALILSGHGRSPGDLDFIFMPGVFEPIGAEGA